MRIGRLLLFVGVLFSFSMCSLAEENTIKMYSLDVLNIREEPKGEVIGSYSKGEEVIVEEYDEEWSKTSKGYVASEYLGETPDGRRDVGVTEGYIDTKGLDFKDKVLNCVDEYVNSDFKYRSSNVFITVDEKEIRNAGTYFLTHIIVKDVGNVGSYYSYNNFGGKGQGVTEIFSLDEDIVLASNGSYFDELSGVAKGIEVNIYDGKLITDGLTTGKEICLTSDGSLKSFDEGLSGQDLLDLGVNYLWASDGDLLINDGEKILSDVNNYSYVYPRTILAMIEPLEYFIISSSGKDNSNGISLVDAQEICDQLGCVYARSLDSGGSVSLAFDGVLVNETSSGIERKLSDFFVVKE